MRLKSFMACATLIGARQSRLWKDASTNEQWDPTNRINELLATDETLVSLDKLREMTTKTLHLEARLRKEYLETKNFVRRSGIGEGDHWRDSLDQRTQTGQ